MQTSDSAQQPYRLAPSQVLVRVISVLVCGLGAASCLFSLTMQVAEMGTLMASAVWFSGLAAVVLALAGYAVSCDVGEGRGHVPLATVCVLVLAIACVMGEKTCLDEYWAIGIALCAAAVELVVLVAYHFVLKANDPEAL